MQAQPDKKGKMAGNANVGEKQLEESETEEESDENLLEKHKIDPGSKVMIKVEDEPELKADVVIGGEVIKADEELSEKKKKKLAQQEAKRKRDEMVSHMTKGTEASQGPSEELWNNLLQYLGTNAS